jgi:hypothetical protein
VQKVTRRIGLRTHARKHRLTAYVGLSLLVPGRRWTQGSGRGQSAGYLLYRRIETQCPILGEGAAEDGVTLDAAPAQAWPGRI